MKCKICGAELGIDEKICHECGNPIEEQNPSGTEENNQGEAEWTEAEAEQTEETELTEELEQVEGTELTEELEQVDETELTEEFGEAEQTEELEDGLQEVIPEEQTDLEGIETADDGWEVSKSDEETILKSEMVKETEVEFTSERDEEAEPNQSEIKDTEIINDNGNEKFQEVMADTEKKMESDILEESSQIGQIETGENLGEAVRGLPNQSDSSSLIEESGQPEKSGKKKGIMIGVAAAAVVGIGAFAFTRMSQKDPKDIVIDAFENIYTEGQVNPLEELFGVTQFVELSTTGDTEEVVTIILDDCSEPMVKEWAGSGMRVSAQNDRTNQKGAADIDMIYKDMDLLSLNAYYGNRILMMAVPELCDKVFTMDLGDGLAERIESSPILGPVLEESEIDVEGVFAYLEEEIGRAESGQEPTLDFDALITRYKEGTQAQEKFKEALLVQKGEKGVFTIDGQEVNCNGYEVVVSKASMIEFLRSTINFFLNDQELKDQYLRQLQQSVKLAELMGAGDSGVSVDEMYADSMEDVTEAVNEMIDFLDKSLNDVNMTVYVDKQGRLTAVDGSTQMNIQDSSIAATEEVEEQDILNIDFECRLQGGSYLTQNMTAEVTMKNSEDSMTISMIKGGTYDGKQVTGDFALNISGDGSNKLDAGVTLTGTYNSEGGDYHMGMGITGDNSLIIDLSMSGIVDQLEKGTSIHADIDELKLTVMDAMAQLTFSGDYGFSPLNQEIKALEGESFDVFAADEIEWQSIFMEIYLNVMQLASQISY